MPEYIERKKLLKLISRWKRDDVIPIIEGHIVGYPEGWNEALEQIESDIEDIPAADVAPVVHGKWIDKTIWFGALGVVYIQCSNCGQVTQRVAESLGDGLGDKYCGNCGAKMDLEVAE